MTRRCKVKVECPGCAHPQSVSGWHSVNVTLNPELRELLFAGEINVFVCTKCKFVGDLPISLLYNDMKLKFWAYYFPAHELENDSFYGAFNADGNFADQLEGFSDESDYARTPHFVFSMRELRRYVIFRERLAARESGV